MRLGIVSQKSEGRVGFLLLIFRERAEKRVTRNAAPSGAEFTYLQKVQSRN